MEMTIQRLKEVGKALLSPISLGLFLAGLASLAAGCAGGSSLSQQPRPGKGLKEYQALVSDASAAVAEALRPLNKLAAQTNRLDPKTISSFCNEVERLQVESIRIRARVQAIQQRGDAYFEAWLKNPDNPQIAAAPARLPELHEAFLRIKQASQRTGDAFKPFLTGLRGLRSQFEANPGSTQPDTIREQLQAAMAQGLQVEQNLQAVGNELQAAVPLIQSMRTNPNP